MHLEIPENKYVYFCSDHHFGAPNPKESKLREERFVNWLKLIKPNASALFILGDFFDFWFEYKSVVPKGFISILAAIKSFSDDGIPVFFFAGNHDLWQKNYLETELGLRLFKDKERFFINKKKFLIAHGDGLGPGDKAHKYLKKIFSSSLFYTLYRWIHPDIGVRLAQYLSLKNKIISGKEEHRYLGDKNEWLFQYAKRKLKTEPIDFFVFGHRHLPLNLKVDQNTRYINLGDWIRYFTFAVFDGKNMEIKHFSENGEITDYGDAL